MFRRIWFSEDSSIGRRLKQFVAFIVPGPLLVAAKKRYYLALLENPKTPREADMEALNQIVRPGDFALDIGAFVGFYTQRLSQLVGATGEVWAFEPVPETFSVLSYAVRELSLNNVRGLNLSLRDSDGEAGTADAAKSRSNLLNMLAVQGYKSFRYADGKFVPCAPDETCQNRFFLTQTHVAEFAQYVRWD
jgi:hypothetical protein